MAYHEQPLDLIVRLLKNGEQFPRRRIVDSLVVARREAGKLSRFRGPGRRARQDKIIIKAKPADLVAHSRRIALATLIEPPVEITAGTRVALGLGMAKQGQVLHETVSACSTRPEPNSFALTRSSATSSVTRDTMTSGGNAVSNRDGSA